MSFFDNTKKFINNSIDSVSKSYEQVSTDVAKAVTPMVQSVKPNVINSTTVIPTEPVKPIETTQNKTQNKTQDLVPFEKQYESSYMGCYSDDPANPSMENYLGKISNISECIDMGRQNNYKYVGIRGGNECFASNSIPKTQSVERGKYCNVGCDDIGTGNCGGFFYNQVYKTEISNQMPILNGISDEQEKEKENEKENEKLNTDATNILENFISSDNDMKKISMGMTSENFNSWKPINVYVIFFWLIIILFIIYLLFEYLQAKKNEKLI